jgi:hypothetical protein
VRGAYRPVADLTEALAWAAELGARTVVFDVEPLVAAWNTDALALRRGVDQVLARADALPRLEVVGFATNSLRRLDGPLGRGVGRRDFYFTAARKPLLVGPYRELPRPGLLVGDQVATDGMLAWRLGYAFAHVRQSGLRVPIGTRLMRLLGSPLHPLLFGARAGRTGPWYPRTRWGSRAAKCPAALRGFVITRCAARTERASAPNGGRPRVRRPGPVISGTGDPSLQVLAPVGVVPDS